MDPVVTSHSEKVGAGDIESHRLDESGLHEEFLGKGITKLYVLEPDVRAVPLPPGRGLSVVVVADVTAPAEAGIKGRGIFFGGFSLAPTS